jgi:AraC family transcriptional regulator
MDEITLKQGQYLGVKLKTADNSLFNLCITEYEPLQVIDNHYHQNTYLSILINGSYTEKNKSYQRAVMPGDILVRPSYYSHQNEFQNFGGRCFNIELKPEWEKMLDTKLMLPAKFNHHQCGAFSSLYRLLINFQSDYSEDLALELIGEWMYEINQRPAVKGVLPWMEKVAGILENELEIFHTLNSLSNRVNVHPVYLARAFKEKKGLTIGAYQLKSKISNALRLLLSTNLSISDIAYRNGFYDDPHFINAFKSAYKLPPQKFRLMVKS